jgi:hypothetical protein
VHGYGPREKGLEHMMPMAAFYPGSGKTSFPVPVSADAEAETEVSKEQVAPGSSKMEEEAPGDLAQDQQQQASRRPKDNAEDDDEEDDEDDEGYGDNDNEEDDEDDEGDEDSSMERMMEAHAAATRAGGASAMGGALYRQMFEKKNMFTSFAVPKASVACAGAGAGVTASSSAGSNMSAKTLNSMPALILDIGVGLQGSDPGQIGREGLERGKALAELSYRVQWRKYFRYSGEDLIL